MRPAEQKHDRSTAKSNILFMKDQDTNINSRANHLLEWS